MKIPERMQALGNRLGYFSRSAWLQLQGVYLEPPVQIEGGTYLKRGFANGACGRISILTKSIICHGVVLDAWGGSIHIAEHVFIGPNTVIYGHGGVSIGRDTLIAMNCSIVSSNHSIPPRSRRIRWEADQVLPVQIGDDVWIGAGVKILGGVRIGDGCIIGAGSTVTRSLEPYSIAIGSPARVIRKREAQSSPEQVSV